MKKYICVCLLLICNISFAQNYFLFHKASGKVLDSNGNDLYFGDFNNGDYQLWSFQDVGNGYIKIINVRSGKVLYSDGSKIHVGVWNGGNFQQWKLESLDNNRFVKIIHKESGKVLDGNAKSFYLLPWNGGDYQKWSKEEKYDRVSWMKNIDDEKRINQLSIPGTHDSGTYGVATEERKSRDCDWYNPICLSIKAGEGIANFAVDAFNSIAGKGWARCQSLSITDQLDLGIRFLDIRCRHFNNALLIHHGSFYCNLAFSGVLDQCIAFLKLHPSESIIMSVKEEYDAEGNTDGLKFWQKVNEYFNGKQAFLYLKNNFPELKDVRGKIVLMRRFEFDGNGDMGISTSIPDDGSECSGNMCVQDIYNVKLIGKVQKENAMADLTNKSIRNPNDTILYMNFTSGFALETPWAFSVINNAIFYHQLPSGKARLGIIPMDFPPMYLVTKIIKSNFN